MTKHGFSTPENTLFGMLKVQTGCPPPSRVNIGNSYVILDGISGLPRRVRISGAYHADPGTNANRRGEANALQHLDWIVILDSLRMTGNEALRRSIVLSRWPMSWCPGSSTQSRLEPLAVTSSASHRQCAMPLLRGTRQYPGLNVSVPFNTKAARLLALSSMGMACGTVGLSTRRPGAANASTAVAGAVVKRFSHRQRPDLNASAARKGGEERAVSTP